VPTQTPPPRLRALPTVTIGGLEVAVAVGLRARLLGLSRLDREAAGPGLLIPRCASVHTFGMRFPLDLVFLDRRGRVLGTRRDVPPRRLIWAQTGAAAVLELPASGGEIAQVVALEGQCCPRDERSRASSSARTTRRR
jgi:uncharacterized membrane protein (UPF0127 family)